MHRALALATKAGQRGAGFQARYFRRGVEMKELKPAVRAGALGFSGQRVEAELERGEQPG